MSLDVHVPDPDRYVREMALPLVDKLFFVDKVESRAFIDYGCADGALLAALSLLCPGAELMGYDESDEMLVRAREAHPGIAWTSDWASVRLFMDRARSRGMKVCVILSSLHHEVLNYGSPAEVALFRDRVWGGGDEPGFDEVAFRDMMVNRAASRPSDPLAVARVRQVFSPRRLAEWEATWGSLAENWSLVHFLLTHRYEANWERELRENYLPMPLEDFLSSIPPRWEAVYMEHFQPPFLRRAVRRTFGFTQPDPTHLKMVLERMP